MFRPIAVNIGLRYTRAKRRNHFISFIAMSSMIGITLGVMVLITVLSVMNGFDEQIQKRVFSMASQISFTSSSNLLPDWEQYAKTAKKNPQVMSLAPYIFSQGMLSANNQIKPVAVFGILPDLESKISELSDKMVAGSLKDLTPGSFGVVLGQELAAGLGADIGDLVTVITPIAALTPVGMEPRFKRFKVVGIFNAGSGFGFDSGYAYIHLADAQKLYQLNDIVSGLRLKIKDVYKAPAVALELSHALPEGTYITNWTEQFGAYFEAIQMEKTMIFLILLLIIAIAAFNLVSSLVMVVTDKEADIAILRTLGATPKTVMSIFMVQGTVIGTVGVITGVLLGILLSLHVTEVVNVIQQIFHVQFISSSVYYVNYLPSKLMANDVIKVSVIAFFLSFIATWYPAWRASRIEPAEALRYE